MDDRERPLQLVSHDPDETRAFGVALGAAAGEGDVFLLDGEFGAGKTVFVQGLARGLGIPTAVTSPSFVIVNQHAGRLVLYHVDLYRAEVLDDELHASVADMLEAGGVTAIEWPGVLPEVLRSGATTLEFRTLGDHDRQLIMRSPHTRLAEAAKAAGADVWNDDAAGD